MQKASKMTTNHRPVFLKEAIELLKVKTGHWYVDATFGGGGHSGSILAQGGKVLAFDFDQQAVNNGQIEFASEIAAHQLILVKENFTQLSQVIKHHGLTGQVSGILFDFGTSTDQLMDEQRGFSFTGEGELDMRMDQSLGVKAKDLLALLGEKQLTEVFLNYGGETEAKKIAKRIVELRKNGKFMTTTKELAELVERTKMSRGKTHPATKVFQALRIVVNDEMDNIKIALPHALESLTAGGHLVTIAFHEGEDRQAKLAFRHWEEQGWGEIVTKKALEPSEAAIIANPRCRSAKLRAFVKK